MEFQALYVYTPQLGKITVVEMIETDEIRQLMAGIDVNWIQGWAVGYPQPIEELLLGQSDSQ